MYLSKSFRLCLLALLLLPVLLFGCTTEPADAEDPADTAADAPIAPENAVWLITRDASGAYVTDYTLIYGTVAPRDRIMGLEIGDRLNFLFKIKIPVYRDTDQPAGAKEIVFGSSESRALAKELADAAQKDAAEGSFLYGFAYREGILALYASNTTARNLALAAFEERFCVEDGLFVPDDLFETVEITKQEYDAILQAEEDRKLEEEARRLEEEWQAYAEKRLPEVKALNEAMDSARFGEARPMGTSPFAAPPVSPEKGQHPRIMLNADMIPDVKAALENPKYAALADTFWSKARTKVGDAMGSITITYQDCVFPEESNSKGRYRYNGNMLAVVEAKALAYLLTGEEIYGYEAIYGIKNAMLSLDYTTAVHMDTYHGASSVIITMATVYDWCYDLLTDTDKAQMTGGITNLMLPQLEFKFPPSNMNGVSGHGTGPQFYRDLTSIALSFYDELPDWWQYVGGRLFEEYIPVLDVVFENGWVSQGASCYAPLKYYNQAWCSWVVEHACDAEGYFPEKMKEAPYFLISELLPNGKFFPSGDGTVPPAGVAGPTCQPLYFAAAISEDVGIMNYTYNTTKQFSQVNNGSVMTLTPSIAVALLSQCPEPTSDNPYAGLDLIRYTGRPGNVLTARNGWESDSAVSWVKASERSMANHDHMDAGTFQLYYKGLLTTSAGSYTDYGSDHFWYYHQATVGHNGLLIADPALYDGTRKEDGTPKSPAKFYYTGSQRRLGEAGTLAKWLSDNWVTARELGHAEGYTAAGAAEYAYMASDITPAYDAKVVTSAVRRMLTVFTENEAAPMLFFTYDSMDSQKAEATKTFVLHTILEPTIEADTRTVITKNAGGGMLVLRTVIGDNARIHPIGGEGRAYEINGVNLLDTDAATDNADKIWGRVEISASGTPHTEFLHAMYAGDASDTYLPTTAVENDQVAGAILADTAAIFVRQTERAHTALSFETVSEGNLRYYVSGVCAGTWTITVNDKTITTAEATEEGGILVFTAPAGRVTLTPAA